MSVFVIVITALAVDDVPSGTDGDDDDDCSGWVSENDDYIMEMELEAVVVAAAAMKNLLPPECDDPLSLPRRRRASAAFHFRVSKWFCGRKIKSGDLMLYCILPELNTMSWRGPFCAT